MEKLLIYLALILFISCKENGKGDLNSLKANQSKENLLFNIGKTYFKKNCFACHKIEANGIGNLDYSFKYNKLSDTLIFKLITKQDSLIKAKNLQATEISEYFGNLYNHNFNFNEKETKAIIYYIKSAKKKTLKRI